MDGWRASYVLGVIGIVLGGCGGSDTQFPADGSVPADVNDTVPGTWSAATSSTMLGLNGVWGSGANDIWAVGQQSLVHWNGTRWATTDSMNVLAGVSGTDMSNVWVVGGSVGGSGTGETPHAIVQRLRGTTFTDVSSGARVALNGVYLRTASDGWAVGTDTIVHWDGMHWAASAVTMPGDLYAVWAASAGDATAVGAQVFRWSGTAWTASMVDGSNYYFGVWGSAANDVWAVGTSGAAQHWNGSRWTRADAGVPSTLYAVWGSAANDVWAAGQDGALAHWNGARWSSVPSGTTSTLRGLWGSGARDVWAVGDRGTIVHYR